MTVDMRADTFCFKNEGSRLASLETVEEYEAVKTWLTGIFSFQDKYYA